MERKMKNLVSDSIERVYSLTSLQEGILYHYEVDEKSTKYISQNIYSINRELHEGYIQSALQLLTVKYPILRTNIIHEKVTKPRQVIIKDRTIEFEALEIASKNVVDSEIDRIAREEINRGFSLQSDSLFRVKYVRCNDSSYMIWTYHHIITDGWCTSIIIRDFIRFYGFLQNGDDERTIRSLVEEEKQRIPPFEKYVTWVAEQDVQEAADYWKRLLEDYDGIAEIRPMPNPGQADDQIEFMQLSLTPELSERIQNVAINNNVTVNNVLEASWGILLQHYGNTDDVVFAKVVSGRDIPLQGIEQMVGLCINTVPFRVKTNRDGTVADLLKDLKEQGLESKKYEYYSLVEIQNQTRQKNQLLKTLFAFQSFPADNCADESGNIKMRLEKSSEETNFDLVFEVQMVYPNLILEIAFNTKTYPRRDIESILHHTEKILDQISMFPDKRINEIDVLTEEEENTILNSFNDTSVKYPSDRNVVDLLEERVGQSPDKTAVIYGDESITYEQLNQKANSLAKALLDYDVKPDDFVVLLAVKSIEAVIGMLGIMKAGAAYIPVNLDDPPERKKAIIDDCQPKAIVLFDAEIETELPVIDLKDKNLYNGFISNPKVTIRPDNLILCIYTSGTTGKPKGVMLEHKVIYNLILSGLHDLGILPLTKVAWLANLTFDASIHEILSTLLSGGTGLMIDDNTKKDIRLCTVKMKEAGVETIFNTTPSYLNALLTEDKGFITTGIKQVLLSGEEFKVNALPTDFAEDIRFFNLYGPSETHCATFKRVNTIEFQDHSIPIGKPFPNVQIYIQRDNKLLGIGMPGEICIAGICLARGYLNDDQLTEKKFAANPFGRGLMYHTGDLGRWLPDGNIEFLGRMDDQVKIRGMRVELGEIDFALRSFESITDCAVIVRNDRNGEKAIFAYYVSDDPISIADVRGVLAHTLPSYMVPAYLMQIAKIPMNRNGKLDKRALPEIEANTGKGYEAPRNETERLLCDIYKDVLGVDTISINDGFFELGGHSLRAMKVTNRIELKTGIKVDIKEIFRTPTVKGLSELINQEKAEEYVPISTAMKKEYYPMSSTQKRLYLICQMDNVDVAYNIPNIFKLTGNVNPTRIKDSMQEIVNRHEALRTEFIVLDGEALQRIRNNVKINFEYCVDLHSDEEELIENFVRPFRLDCAPLLRVRLVKQSGHYLLMIDTHHIICDGETLNILLCEFATLYNGKKIETLPRQYKDYSEWMRTRDLSEQERYWFSEFDGEIPLLDMPLDYARPQKQSFRGGTTLVKTSVELYGKIKRLVQHTGATEYMVFLSAVMVLLSKYSGQDDIVIGSPISARTHHDTEGMMGMFVNTLAMRGASSGEKQYDGFLAEVKEKCLRAYENQEYPFERLVDYVNRERDISRNPIFSIFLMLQNFESPNIRLDDVLIENTYKDDGIAKFDLSFSITDLQDEYEIELEYCSDLYSRETVGGLLQHLIVILEQVAENETKRIREIEIITEDERERIFGEFNDTYVEYPREKTVTDLFEEQVRKTPENIAVIFEEEQISYGELNEKANQLARKLRDIGVKPNDFICLLTERSIEMVIGLYGILKAGGAYVPISTGYPKERIKHILHDCKPKAVLVYKADIETSIPVIDLGDKETYRGQCEDLPGVNSTEDYIFCTYTSGTTGMPKGIVVRHRNFTNLVTWYRDAFSLSETDKTMLMSPLSFNLTQRNIFGPHISGGAVCAYGSENVYDADRAAAYIHAQKITMINCSASAFYALDLADKKNGYANLETLKKVYLSGEALVYARIRDYMRAPNCKAIVVNGYGATENTGMATAYQLNVDLENQHIMPIGKPLNNEQMYIIKDGKLCGIGIKGEICICGDGVTDGYLNNAGLTAEKFVENPYGEGKMYRSGDLGRWLPNGCIEYLGRMDNQVKVRGLRIDLGEVETALRDVQGVRECVVTVREDEHGDNAIYAYIVGEGELSIPRIRGILAKTLPGYMIPAYISQIDRVPLTHNGKLDTKALPVIEAKSGRYHEAPRTEMEQMLCEIYQEVLNAEAVSINDSFFDLGGHSLNALRVINRIEGRIGKKLDIRELFAAPMIRELSEILEDQQVEKYREIPFSETKEYYPMSSTQKRVYVVCQMDNVGVAYNMPRIMRMKGEVEADKLEAAIQKIIDRHEILRTEFLLVDGEPMQRIRSKVKADFQYIQNETKQEEELIREFVRPFDFERAPLLRAKLVKRQGYYLFMLDTHHIISDGMSEAMFTRELNTLYNEEGLRGAPRQYKDYSEWIRQRDLSGQAAYWLNEFDGDIPELDIPTDYAQPKVQSYDGAMVELAIDEELSAEIRQLASQTETTEYMVLLSAVMILLEKYSGQEDIVIGSPVSARTHRDTESMMGMFVNMLAIRGAPTGDKRYLNFLGEIKEKCLKAYDNQEYPFEELVEAVNAHKNVARSPLFKALFALHNNEIVEVKFNNVSTEYIDGALEHTKFSLSFKVLDQDGEYHVFLEYHTHLYSEATVKNLLEHYRVILSQIVEDRNRRIRDIEVITQAERERILGEFNDTYVEYERDKTVLDLFEEQVIKTPGNTAVVCEEQNISYEELNRRANGLAWRLRELGVGTDDFVCMLVPRGFEMLVGLYGTLKAGGAYVPIGTDYPRERVQQIIDDCKPMAILTCGAEVETQLPVLDLTRETSYAQRSGNLEHINGVEDYIYCTYTSGSTGTPKGIPVRHRNIMNLVTWYRDAFELGEADRVMLMAPLSFDLTQRNIFAPHIAGAAVCLCGNENIYNADEAADCIQVQEVTMINCAASAFYALLAADTTNSYRRLESLKQVYLVGEPLVYARIKDYMEAGNRKGRVVNGYGTTEDSGIASTYAIEEASQCRTVVPIGKALNNKQMYIVRDGHLCGIGVKGEICICGEGVTDGYLNDPELTAQRFVKNPYGAGPMYRTGDLGRWLPNGNIEYLGRMDDQVKVRGLRIELGEIETALRGINGVQDSAVIVQENEYGDNAIYAYIVGKEELNVQRIRGMLSKTLPAYMIPPYLKQITKIPVTRNGKLDRRALPQIEASSGKQYVAPRTEIERVLCEIFKEVLRAEVVGIDDSFFEMGGHSLNALRIVNRVDEKVGKKLNIREIFTMPTIRELSEILNEQSRHDYQAIPLADGKELYPMSSAQKRIFVICQMDNVGTAYNMPRILKMRGEIDSDKIAAAIQKIIDRHEILRTEFLLVDGEPMQRIRSKVKADFQYIQNETRQEEELIREFVRPFDFEQAPLLRVKLVKRPDHHLFMLDTHHIVSDGISIGTLLNEFSGLYNNSL